MGDFIGVEPVQLDGFDDRVSGVALRPGTSQVAVCLANGDIVVSRLGEGQRRLDCSKRLNAGRECAIPRTVSDSFRWTKQAS